MIRQIAPQCFTRQLAATLAYYRDTLGFERLGTWHDPTQQGLAEALPAAEPPGI